MSLYRCDTYEKSLAHAQEKRMKKLTQTHLDEITKDAAIEYLVLPGTNITICTMTLPCGFVLIGKSVCMHKDTFDKAVGENLALKEAEDKLWELEAYHRMRSGDISE